ncbi:MAG: IclR family transcriptional regulator [Chloroflexi bacterium]|nr:IclR family transcriptional regulator [Chloroflexota bacterium]
MKHSVPLNQSVTRGLAVLEYLASADVPKDLAVISHELGMAKSTTFRFLSTLVEQGYVRQEPDVGRYYLGSKVTWLAAKFLDRLEVRQAARPALDALAKETGETVHLAILDQDMVVYIDKIDGQQSVRMASRIGYRMPVHSTSLGKVLLSDFPESEWRRYASQVGLKAYTENTIVEPDLFFRELRQVRAHDYAVDNVENEAGIRCIAAPIRDHTGKVVAALSISGWTLSMTATRVNDLVPLIRQASSAISRQLGFQEPHALGQDPAPLLAGAETPTAAC